jgi:hypothetical protein
LSGSQLQATGFAGGKVTCAWHGALAELLAIAGSHKTPAVTGRKGNANKARATPEMGCLKEA